MLARGHDHGRSESVVLLVGTHDGGRQERVIASLETVAADLTSLGEAARILLRRSEPATMARKQKGASLVVERPVRFRAAITSMNSPLMTRLEAARLTSAQFGLNQYPPNN